MNYFSSKTLSGKNFDTVKSDVVAGLKEVGFGILTEIDLKTTMKEKLDKDYLPHVILGACNPGFADKVLTQEPRVSTLLPCNVTVRELESGDVEVAAMNPVSVMEVVGNDAIKGYAEEVRDRIQSVIDGL